MNFFSSKESVAQTSMSDLEALEPTPKQKHSVSFARHRGMILSVGLLVGCVGWIAVVCSDSNFLHGFDRSLSGKGGQQSLLGTKFVVENISVGMPREEHILLNSATLWFTPGQIHIGDTFSSHKELPRITGTLTVQSQIKKMENKWNADVFFEVTNLMKIETDPKEKDYRNLQKRSHIVIKVANEQAAAISQAFKKAKGVAGVFKLGMIQYRQDEQVSTQNFPTVWFDAGRMNIGDSKGNMKSYELQEDSTMWSQDDSSLSVENLKGEDLKIMFVDYFGGERYKLRDEIIRAFDQAKNSGVEEDEGENESVQEGNPAGVQSVSGLDGE